MVSPNGPERPPDLPVCSQGEAAGSEERRLLDRRPTVTAGPQQQRPQALPVTPHGSTLSANEKSNLKRVLLGDKHRQVCCPYLEVTELFLLGNPAARQVTSEPKSNTQTLT